MRKFPLIIAGGLALTVTTTALLGAKRLVSYLPIAEFSNNGIGRGSNDVVVEKAGACSGGMRWIIKNNSARAQTGIVCRHFVSGGGGPSSTLFERYTLAGNTQQSLMCMPDNANNFYEAHWSDVASHTAPSSLQNVNDSMIIEGIGPARHVINLNKHKRITINYQLMPRGPAYIATLEYLDGAPVGSQGGVITARYEHPYFQHGDMNCSSFPDP